jgi:hypothetical protein
MHSTVFATSLLAFLGTVSAHMEMSFPPPLKSKFNPNSGSQIDYSMTAPLSGDGSNFPCKGFLNLLGTDAGKSVATFAPGTKGNVTIVGGAPHNGGSCQISLSYDKGKTFTVIQSIIGNCPVMTSGNFDFTVPTDAPSGDALLAWTWFNNVGNREMYMNCASVTIGGGKKRSATEIEAAREKRAASFGSRPAMFVANDGNGCTTIESSDLQFPDPGPDVLNQSSNTKPPSGNCGATSNPGSGSSSRSGSQPTTTAAASTPARTTTAASTAQSSRYLLTSRPLPFSPVMSESYLSSKTLTVIPIDSPPLSCSSLTGSIYVTIGNPASSTPASASPTTFATATNSSRPGPGSSSRSVSVAATGASTAVYPTSTAAGSGSGTGGAGAFAPGTPCSDEGAWNCIGGNSFQRCASGSWSAVIAMAAGTSCNPGISDNLIIMRNVRRAGPKRRVGAWID